MDHIFDWWWELPGLPNLGENSQPQYLCEWETFGYIASSPSAAISNVYEKIFHNKTRLLIIWLGKFCDGYKSSLIHSFGKKVAIFVPKIEKEQCILQIYQELLIWQHLLGLDDQIILYQHQEITIIELSTYPIAYEFNEREKSARCSFLRAAGCMITRKFKNKMTLESLYHNILHAQYNIGRHLILESRKYGRTMECASPLENPFS
ncbi:hypothetical protein Glove_217g191 [Diversispora epigaea]|uniref:Uncharacterized protein n=1 Tax=Diversispora epigaea TaxID=1348612 RepID=A0A397IPX0_9GLOM|nr:hypothetical protein Glove_217g191 [Diversispora epigaea]